MAKNQSSAPVTALFLDVGGVMLTNGWDRKSREAAAKKFGLDLDEMNDRHRMTFEIGAQGGQRRLAIERREGAAHGAEARELLVDDGELFVLDLHGRVAAGIERDGGIDEEAVDPGVLGGGVLLERRLAVSRDDRVDRRSRPAPHTRTGSIWSSVRRMARM